MSLRRIVVLDCGISRVSAGVFVERKGALSCESSSAAPLPSVAIENWPAATTEAIAGVLANFPRRLGAVLVLPSQAVLLKQMRTPRVSPAKSRQVLEFAVGQAIPHAVGELVWDALNSGTYDAEIDHLVVAAKVSTVAPILRAMQSAGLEVRAMIPSILALRAAETICSPAVEPRRLLIETSEWGIAFLQTDGARFALRSLTSTATKPPSASEATTLAELTDGIMRLAQEATRTWLYFNRQNNFEAPAKVVLAPDKSWDPEMRSRFGDQLKRPVGVLEASAPGPVLSEAIAGSGMATVRLLGGVAIGLGRTDHGLNLVPKEIRKEETSRRKTPWLIAASLLSVAVFLPPLFVLRAESVLRQQQIAKLESMLTPLQARSKRMQEEQAQIAELNRERERLRSLANVRTGWLGLLAALQDRLAMVEDTWLERLQTVAPQDDAPMKLVLHGCMLDRGTQPVAKKMKILVRELREIPDVGAVEGARFDTGSPYLLRFELVLVLDAARAP